MEVPEIESQPSQSVNFFGVPAAQDPEEQEQVEEDITEEVG